MIYIGRSKLVTETTVETLMPIETPPRYRCNRPIKERSQPGRRVSREFRGRHTWPCGQATLLVAIVRAKVITVVQLYLDLSITDPESRFGAGYIGHVLLFLVHMSWGLNWAEGDEA